MILLFKLPPAPKGLTYSIVLSNDTEVAVEREEFYNALMHARGRKRWTIC